MVGLWKGDQVLNYKRPALLGEVQVSTEEWGSTTADVWTHTDKGDTTHSVVFDDNITARSYFVHHYLKSGQATAANHDKYQTHDWKTGEPTFAVAYGEDFGNFYCAGIGYYAKYIAGGFSKVVDGVTKYTVVVLWFNGYTPPKASSAAFPALLVLLTLVASYGYWVYQRHEKTGKLRFAPKKKDFSPIIEKINSFRGESQNPHYAKLLE